MLFKLICSENVEEETKTICLEGLVKIFANFKPKKIIQPLFESLFGILKEQPMESSQLALLELLTVNLVPSQGLFSVNIFKQGNWNIDKNFFKDTNLLKTLNQVLRVQKLEEKDKETIEKYFKIFNVIIQKFGDILLEKQYFNKIWIVCYNLSNEVLQSQFLLLIKENYKRFQKFDIFPGYFQSEVVALSQTTLPFLNFFFYLFLLENQQKGCLQV